MRYLLDTNILVHLVREDKDKISYDIWNIIDDFSNRMYASSISIVELFQLYRIGKIKTPFKTKEAMITYLESQYYVDILPFGKIQAEELAGLDIHHEHNDPFDHAIIAHAISNKMVLISSDRKFEHYAEQGLDFINN